MTRRIPCLALAAVFLAAGFLCAGDAARKEEAKKEDGKKEAPKKKLEFFFQAKPEAIDPTLLSNAARASLAKAVEYLKHKAMYEEIEIDGKKEEQEKEEREWWFVPPWKQKKIVDYKEYEVRYRAVKVKEPIWKYKYEYYDDLAFVKKGDSTDKGAGARKVKKRRVVGRTKVGEREVTHHVHDPKGPIVKTHKRPIYGPGGPDLVPHGFYAQNAMGVYALLKCGVSPRDQVINTVMRNLKNFIDAFGMPDKTWDLAWLAVAFSNMYRGMPQGLPGELANRLLDGQIQDGKGRGMWGPVCINTKLLSKMIEYEQILSTEVAKRKADLASRPNSKMRQELVAKYEKFQQDLSKRYLEVTQQGMRFQAVTDAFILKNEELFPEESKTTHGLSWYIYDRTIADLERTAVALFALRQAQENGCLAEATYRLKTPTGGYIVPPEKVPAVLGRAAAVIASMQKADGTWDDGNLFQEEKNFDKLPIQEIKGKRKEFPEFPSRRTLVSTAEGYAALANIGQTIGMDRFLKKYQAQLEKGEAAMLKAVEEYLRRAPEPVRKKWERPAVENEGDEVPTGRFATPYDFLFQTHIAHLYRGGYEVRRPDLWRGLAYRTLGRQKTDGSWDDYRSLLFSSSWVPLWDLQWRERYAARAGGKAAKAPRAPKGKKGKKDKADPVEAQLRRYWANLRSSRYWMANEPVVRTAYAMLLLAEGVRPPVAGVIATSEDVEPPEVLKQAIQGILRDRLRGIWVNYARVDDGISQEELNKLPVVFLSGSGSMGGFGPGVPEKLKSYVESDGFVVVVAGTDMAGQKFINDARVRLESLLGGRIEQLPETDQVLSTVAKKPSLDVMLIQGGDRVICMFLPIHPSKTPPPGKVNMEGAAAVVKRVIETRSEDWLLDRELPMSPDAEGKIDEIWAEALQQLVTRAEIITNPPEVVEEAVEKEKPAEKKEPKKDEELGEIELPAEKKKAPAADETW